MVRLVLKGSPMGQKRLGIIGLGMAVAPHAQALGALRDRVEVAYAFSRSSARRHAFAEKFDFPLCDSITTILDDASVSAVLVLTPANTHLEIVERCARAGKHILLEKPLDVSTERAERLVALCEKAGVTLGIVLQHRFKPAALKLASFLSSGELGDIIGCSATIALWRPQSYYDEPGRGTLARDGGGVLITQGIHTLDLMLSLVGPASEVAGYSMTTPIHRMEGEDLVCAAVKFCNGAIGTIHATTAAYPGFPERIDLIGRHATASLVGNSLSIHWQDGRTFDWASDDKAGGTGADPMAFSHASHQALIADFIDALSSKRPAKPSGRDVLAVHHLIDALIATGRTGQAVRVAG